ncbi:MAG TPA: hypothetical protein VIE43_25065, partial [Thermoanaerobaculia bacterium]|nr:hypothetical protein [Thermoanaerobaculia bacterium]
MKRALSLLIPVFLLALAVAFAADPPAADKAATVDVHLKEYSIDMPATLPAGPTTFVVHNDGTKSHSFRIEAPGTSEIIAKPVPMGETASLTV